MNTKNLAKNYNQLTARERLPLLLAASARGDAVEQHRLMNSAPRIGLSAPHHYRLGEALITAAHLHMMTLLDLAVKYWQWWGLWGWHGLRRETKTDQRRVRGKRAAATPDTEEVRHRSVMRHHAFLFITYVDGWRQFCADLLIDADALLHCYPGWDMVTQTEKKARENAYSREDAIMFLLCDATATHGDESEDGEIPSIPPVPTVEGLAKEWHEILDRGAAALSGSR